MKPITHFSANSSSGFLSFNISTSALQYGAFEFELVPSSNFTDHSPHSSGTATKHFSKSSVTYRRFGCPLTLNSPPPSWCNTRRHHHPVQSTRCTHRTGNHTWPLKIPTSKTFIWAHSVETITVLLSTSNTVGCLTLQTIPKRTFSCSTGRRNRSTGNIHVPTQMGRQHRMGAYDPTTIG